MENFLKDPSFSDLKFYSESQQNEQSLDNQNNTNKQNASIQNSSNNFFNLDNDFLNVGTNVNSVNINGFSSSSNNPVIDDFEPLNFQASAINIPTNNEQFNSNSFNDYSNSLDEVLSPTNNTFNSLQSSQYFSPNGSNFDTGNIPNSFNINSVNRNTDSPNNGVNSINVPQARSFNNNYLSSPNFNSPYDNSYDTLRSPSMKSPRMSALSPTSSSTIPKQPLSREEKIKRRREFHNAVERRRRDLIKERIKELGLLVPPSLLNTSDNGKIKETKANKSVILNKTVDYITHLNIVLKEQDEARQELIDRIKYLENLPDSNQASSNSNLNSNSNLAEFSAKKNDESNAMDDITNQFMHPTTQNSTNTASINTSNFKQGDGVSSNSTDGNNDSNNKISNDNNVSDFNNNDISMAGNLTTASTFNPEDFFPEMKNADFEDQFWNDNDDIKLDF